MELLERAFFIIKPDAYKYTERIFGMILKIPLLIDEAYEVKLPFEFLKTMYNDDENKFKQAAAKYNSAKLCVVGIVSGYDTVRKLTDICGKSFRSHECAEGTIRRTFNVGGPVMVDGVLLDRNAIHRSDAEEVFKDIELFYHYLDSGKFEYVKKIV